MSQTKTTNNLHTKVGYPCERHIYSKINQKTIAKETNTIIEPGVDYNKDIKDIREGKAKYIADAEKQQFEVNGRTYKIHDKARKNGYYRSYPIEGNGMHKLNRGEFQAFKMYKTHSNNPQLLKKIISNQKKSYVKSSSQEPNAAERSFEKAQKRGRNVLNICQAKEKAIFLAKKGHSEMKIFNQLKGTELGKKDQEAVRKIAKNVYKDHQDKTQAQNPKKRVAKGVENTKKPHTPLKSSAGQENTKKPTPTKKPTRTKQPPPKQQSPQRGRGR